MKKFLKFLIVIMLLASFITVLAACGGTQNGDGSTDDGSDVTTGDDTQNGGNTDGDNDGDSDDEEVTTPEYTYSLVEDGTAYELIKVITDEKIITIPALYNDKPVVGIGTEVFRNTQIEEVNLPDTLTYLSERAFSLCISLKKVNLTTSSSLQKIGEKAFYQCEYLHTITLPETLEEVGASAFEGCIDLVSLNIPSSIKVVGENAFECGWYRNLTDKGVIYVGKVAYSYIQGEEQTATVTLRNDTIAVAEKAFYGNDIITAVTIPASVTCIGDLAFNAMSKLQTITVDSENAKYSSEGNALIEIATDKLLVGTYQTEIPAYIATLGKESFAYIDNADLTTIFIPDSVTAIEEGAFRGIKSLKNIDIPMGVTFLSDYLFFECSALESIKIKMSVNDISNTCFARCTSLKTVTIDSDDVLKLCALKVDAGHLLEWATTVYVIDGIEAYSHYLVAFFEVVTSDRAGYTEWNITQQ